MDVYALLATKNSGTITKITAVWSTAKQFPTVGLTVQFTSWANILCSVVARELKAIGNSWAVLYLEKSFFNSNGWFRFQSKESTPKNIAPN